MVLEETAATDISVSFQNGALVKTAQTTWTALDLFATEHADLLTQPLVLRKGDSLKLSAQTAAAEGDVSWSVKETVSSKAVATDFTQLFDTAGDQVITATFAGVTKTLTVKVVDFELPKNADGTGFKPAAMLGLRRSFTLTALPTDFVVEADETLNLTRDGENISVTPTEINKAHDLVIRAYADGPIIKTLPIELFWVQAAVDNRFWVLERHDDYEIWQNTLVTKNIPSSIKLKVRMHIGGATLEDGTLERWVENDLDELGEYSFKLIHPNSLDHSACHKVEIYQGETYLGQAAYGGKLTANAGK